MTHYIQKNYRLSPEKENPPTILYENNATCITQLKRGCIKGHRTKIFHQKNFTHDLPNNGEIDV